MNMLKINCKNLIPKHYLKHRIILIVIFALLTFGYVFTFMPRTTFDDINTASDTTQEIVKGDTFIQEINVSGGVIKGLKIDFNNFFRRNIAQYNVDLLDENKQVIASNIFNGDKLTNEGAFSLPIPNITVNEGENYYIAISTNDGKAGNAIGVFLNETGETNAQLNGEELNGSLAFALGYKSFSINMVLITIFFVFILSLAILFWGKKLHNNVLVMVIILGVFFALFTPILDTPDETEHFAKPMHMINGGFITSTSQGGSYLSNSFAEVIANKGSTIIDNALIGVPYDTQTTKELWGSGQFFFGYLPQTAGLALARLFNVGILPLFYMGRIFNVIIYALFAWLAIKTAPKYKLYLAILSIMPMALIITSSYNSDGLIYGLCLLLGGYLIDMIYNRTYKITLKNILIFSGILTLIVMKKYSLMPFALLLLFIPSSRFINKKTKYGGFVLGGAITIGVMLLLFAINVALNMDVSGAQTSALAPGGVNQRGASMYGQIGFILAHPTEAYSIFTKTIMNFAGDNLLQMFSLGWLTYDVYSIFAFIYFAFMAVVAFSYSKYEYDGTLNNTQMSLVNRFGVLIIMLLGVFITYLMLYLSWTAVGGATIEGVQGRYFVPILFLLPLIGQNVFPVVTKDAYERGQINVLFVALLFSGVTFLTVLTNNY